VKFKFFYVQRTTNILIIESQIGDSHNFTEKERNNEYILLKKFLFKGRLIKIKKFLKTFLYLDIFFATFTKSCIKPKAFAAKNISHESSEMQKKMHLQSFWISLNTLKK
jgi:predicted RNA-binding protein (virulence factor B family)